MEQNQGFIQRVGALGPQVDNHSQELMSTASRQRKGVSSLLLSNETLDVCYHTPYTDFELHAFVACSRSSSMANHIHNVLVKANAYL